ncbi:MAG: hypothetical protein HY611_07680 [Elusimicrobia bacterium]|nr:hypothetical protein [Elusimicrobiota bacterium]
MTKKRMLAAVSAAALLSAPVGPAAWTQDKAAQIQVRDASGRQVAVAEPPGMEIGEGCEYEEQGLFARRVAEDEIPDEVRFWIDLEMDYLVKEKVPEQAVDAPAYAAVRYHQFSAAKNAQAAIGYLYSAQAEQPCYDGGAARVELRVYFYAEDAAMRHLATTTDVQACR